MNDPYIQQALREIHEERGIDINRETAAECDGITPANVATWTQYRVENMDGTTNLNATANALCAAVAGFLDENATIQGRVDALVRIDEASRSVINGLMEKIGNMEDEIITLRNQCQVHLMEKDELRIQRSEALGKFFALARALMQEELEAGNVPQALARDLSLTTISRAA